MAAHCAPSGTEGASMTERKGYQWLLILLLSFNFGVVFFDRNAFSFLVPFIQPELGLSNFQIGLIAGAFSFTWALAGLGVGRLSDYLGRRKLILVVATLVFSLASALSGLAGSFLALLAARLLMGMAEGGIMPISQTLIVAEVDPERRGLAQGITQNFGANIIANFLGPIVIVAMASAWGWRHAFYVAALPGLVMGALIAWLVHDPPMPVRPAASPAHVRAGAGALLADRTILLCILISIVLVAYLVVFAAFMPLYLVQVRGIDKQAMSYVLSSFGLFSIAVAILIPGASDFLGRRPVLIVAGLLGMLMPLGVLLTQGTNPAPLYLSFALGSILSGAFPLAMATVPSEIVDPSRTATTLSLTMGLSEIIGGVCAPVAAGWFADREGLAAPLWIMTGLSLAVALLALLLREPAPRVLARRAAAAADNR
ncbi:MAG: MFS transporter [Gammaproteobacteria bacterium]|nr:MFS transporter [Gammaproteobacteria bacterium]